MASPSKTNHVTAVTMVQVTDLAAIAGRPDLPLANQTRGRSDILTPPRLNVQFAAIMNLTINNDPAGINGTTPRV